MKTGYYYRGFIDWRHPTWPDGYPTVGDHKTTAALKWAKTEEDLKTDIQATLYAYDTMAHYHADKVRLQWTYMQTRGTRKSLPVVVTVGKDATFQGFERIEIIAARMATTLHTVDSGHILDLPPSPSHCEAFGGCPYQGKCNLSPSLRMGALLHQGFKNMNTLSLLERLKSRQLSVVQDTTPAIVETAFGPGVNLDASASDVAEAIEAVVAEPVKPGQINPPEQSPPITVLDATPKKGRPAGRKNRPKAFATSEPLSETQKAIIAAEDAEDLASASSETVSLEDVKQDTTPAPPYQAKVQFLCVDCYPVSPVKAPIMLCGTLSEMANAKISAETGKADYRFLEYGQGVGALVRAAIEILDGMGDVHCIVLDSHTPEGSALLGALSTRANLIVRGLR
jgi:hypothetical protein